MQTLQRNANCGRSIRWVLFTGSIAYCLISHILIGNFFCLAADAAGIADLSGDVTFDIPAQSLQTALLRYSEQANVQIVVSDDLVKKYRTSGLSGKYSRARALQTLLSQSGLIYRFTAEGTVAISLNKTIEKATGPPPATGPPTTSTGYETLQEVTVTARRRTERLIDVPVAASTLSGQDLARYAISTFDGIAQQTPQLLIGPVPTEVGGVVSLRGIGASETDSANDQPVSINIDGIALNQATVLGLGQYDLDNVEVLKGPQTVFFGKNSPAGAISMTSKDPGPSFEAQARSGYEFYNEQRYLELIASGPLSGGFGARLVGYLSGETGWFENDAVPISGLVQSTDPARGPDQTEKFARLTLTYASPDRDFDARWKVNFGDILRHNGFDIYGVQNFACPAGMPAFNVSITECQLNRYYQQSNVSAAVIASSPEGAFGDGKPRSDTNQLLTSLEMNYALSEHLKLTSVAGLYHLHANLLNEVTSGEIPLVALASNLSNDQKSEELRLASEFGRLLDFQTGLFWESRKVTEWAPVGFAPGIRASDAIEIPIVDIDVTTHALSGFAEIDYKIAPGFEFTAGGRYSHEKKALGGTVGGGTFNAPYTPIADTLSTPSRVFTNLSPELTLSYKPAPDLTAYASYRTGFTSGGYNDPSSGYSGAKYDASFGQSTTRGGEVGFKGYAFDRQLRFDATGYFYKYNGLQVSAFDPITTSAVTENAATATIRGIEANTILSLEQVRGLSVRLAFAYNEAKYGTFNTAGCYGGQTIADGCNGGFESGAYTTQNLSGRPLQRAPRWAVNPGFTYEPRLSGWILGSFSVDAAYTGSYFTLLEEDPRSLEAGYWIINSALSVRAADNGWEIALIGRNIANKLTVESSFDSILTGSGTGTAKGVLSDLAGALNAPRTVVLQFTVRSSLSSVL